MRIVWRIALTALGLACLLPVATPGALAMQGKKALFIGHSFHQPIVSRIPFLAGQAGITGHTQATVTAGGANGAPQALWEDPTKSAEIKAILHGGDIEVFGMTYHGDYPTAQGYENWIGYALEKKSDTEIVLGLPWGNYPESVSAATYASNWIDGHAGGWHDLIEDLRDSFPSAKIRCIPYGQSGLELRLLFANNNLPDVNFVVGSAGDAIHVDALGHAADILKELAQLTYFSAFYEVDLDTLAYNPGFTTNLMAIAKSVVDAHDATYNPPVPVPATSPWAAAFLATLLLAVGAWIIVLRGRARGASSS